ncbi:virulence protein [Acidaminobacter hydrogenoformans]|uniref:Virulence-related protein n=1 Tax=Acidaminobacter hydrogenoformans DSM 2784 TaxID=1120920 RepID=A0A1G5S3M4_9FIRM|nr:virulence protein [Acidaminobacter hydrogenoformans]SCZ80430.1 hypothetical protein SAMN03080599_02266 [Acidaminobacter hydrogenoformans DSM 2784]
MEIKFNISGINRKELVTAIGELVGKPIIYKGAPTFSYDVGDFTIDKSGTLLFPVKADSDLVSKVITGLSERGLEFDESEMMNKLSIEMPLDGFTEESIVKLEKLISSKASLIKKALGATELTIEKTAATLKFPWFKFPATSDEVAAYSQFISALCSAAKEQKKVTARDRVVDNEKFAFRVFLIRLGFVGEEYKLTRKILLRNLSGSSAYASFHPTKADQDEILVSEVNHE